MKVSIKKLTPNPGNPRLIKDARFEQLVKSIQDFPQMLELRPIVVDEDFTILGGNMRYRALQHLGHKEVEVTIAEGLTEEQKREFVIKDNNSFGEYDWDILANEGWSDLPLNEWGVSLPEDWLNQPDELPEEGEYNGQPPAEPVTVLGDLYELNKHRIHCADSTNSDAVAKTLNGKKPTLMVTDPPYGVDYDPDWRLEAGINKAHQTLASGRVENDNRSDWREAWSLFTGDVAYVWHGALHSANVAESLESCGFQIRSQIIWAKPSLVMGRGHYHWQHEPCWYAVRKGATGNWQGDRKQATLWDIANMHRTQGTVDDGKTNHSTQKPIECMKRPIENNTAGSQVVYDPFLGSGTTLIACQQTGRTCYANELSAAYVDMCVTRWLTYMRTNNLPYQVKRNGVLLSEAELNELTGEDQVRNAVS